MTFPFRPPFRFRGLFPALAPALLFLTTLCERARALTIGGYSVPSFELGTHFSLAVVDGRPAIAWAGGDFKSVKYTRALDADGAAWGPQVVIDMGEDTGRHMKLIVADGNPAVCYLDGALGKLRYARALDAQGSAWSDPGVLETGPRVPSGLAMESVGGFPAVCFPTAAGLKYLRASDARGSAWGAAKTLDSSVAGSDLSMKVVQGNPAVAYARTATPGFGVYYLRASDTAGVSWPAPRLVGTQTSALRAPAPCLEVVSGVPAVAWCLAYPSLGLVNYRRATDVQGSVWRAWVAPGLVSSRGTPGLAVIGSRPAIAFFEANTSDLVFLHAQDPAGESTNSWPAPVQVDGAGNAGQNPSLRDVNGLPAIVYLNASKKTLEYVRASGPVTALRWPAQLQVTTPGPGIDEPLISGSTHDFRVVALGWEVGKVYDLFNPNAGSVDLEVTSYTLEGPDAAEFSLLEFPSPPYTLKPAGWVDGPRSVIVQCKPLTPGYKNAVLRIGHNGNPSPFTLAFTADVNPHLALTPRGRETEGGYQLDLPPAHPGSPQELVFTIHNYGGAELNSIAVTIDGPDAAEFSVRAPPPLVVAPQQKVTFTVRHTTLTNGPKTAALRVASNAVGEESLRLSQTTLRLIAGAQDTPFTAPDDPVFGLAVQPDGKILTAGESLRRLLPGGTIDPAFFSPVIESLGQMTPGFECVAVQRDGRILAGGSFGRVNGQPRGCLVRLHADGSLDDSFAPALGSVVHCMAIQPDGKILIGGVFGATAGGVPPALARLHADGTADTSFAPGVDGGEVRCLTLQPDGKILAGGSFYQGNFPRRMVRLNSDGGLDTAFPFGPMVPAALALLPDGRVLAGGDGNGTSGLRRYLPDGTVDPVPAPMTGNPVTDLALQADGACLITGTFLDVGGALHQDAVRLLSDDTVDAGFDTLFEYVSFRRLALLAGGSVLLAGEGHGNFEAPDALVRLGNDPAISVLRRDTPPDTVRWLRGGTAPAVTDVSFDFKPMDAAAWTPLGFGVPVADGWELELSGPALPVHGTLRAQGRSGGSLIEAVAWFLPPLEMWRVTHFHTPDATGDAANDADPDNDGLTNLVEFAFGSSPVDRSDRNVPVFELTPGGGAGAVTLTAAFTAPPGRDNIRYAAEQSDTLLPGTWTAIPDTGSENEHIFRTAPNNGNGNTAGKVFVRFVLSLRQE